MGKEKILGIDLGTTNSCMSVMIDGKPEIIANLEGKRTTPSFVQVTPDGFAVGEEAKRSSVMYPENTFFEVKRYIGHKSSELGEQGNIHMPYKVELNGEKIFLVTSDSRKFTPEEISAQVIRYLVDCARHAGFDVKKVVITVPAYFNDAQRAATKAAGEIAGVEVVRIINEPTAAALAFGQSANSTGKTAVFDLGGGTFDVSILEKTVDEDNQTMLEVLATGGVNHLGGADFDDAIRFKLIENFKKKHGIDLSKEPVIMNRLKHACEEAKIALSTKLEVEISIPFIKETLHLNEKITRSQFENLIQDILYKVKQPCIDTLKKAGCYKEENGKVVADVDRILLVGGSTKIPKVLDVVKEIFGKEPLKHINPDEAVAAGAAVQAGILEGNNKDNIVIVDVSSLSVGLETQGGTFHILIPSNTPIPTKKSQIFTTATDNQESVTIMVYQGERPVANKNKLLGNFSLDGIAPAPRGIPQIEVTFEIDVNGVLDVSAKDVKTNKTNKITITNSNNLSKEEIERMKADAEKYAEEDKKRKKRVELINQGENLIYTAENTLKKQEGLSEALKNEIEDKKNILKDTMEKIDVKDDEIQKKIDELSESLQKSYADMTNTNQDKDFNQSGAGQASNMQDQQSGETPTDPV